MSEFGCLNIRHLDGFTTMATRGEYKRYQPGHMLHDLHGAGISIYDGSW